MWTVIVQVIGFPWPTARAECVPHVEARKPRGVQRSREDAQAVMTVFLRRVGLLAWLLIGQVACAPGLVVRPLEVLEVASAGTARVTAYLDVTTAQGDHVVGLESGAFRVFEAGRQLDATRAKLRLDVSSRVAAYRTVLLVDISRASLSGSRGGELVAAAAALVRSLSLHQPVAVFAFDGARRLHPIAPFGSGSGGLSQRLSELREIDPRTNLHGAVIEGLQELDRGLGRVGDRLRYGSLVVLTDGSDRAGRVPLQAVRDALQASPHRVLTVGVGSEADDSTLARLGRDGYVRVDDRGSLARAIRLVASDVVAPQRGRYLLTYCGRPNRERSRVRVVVTRGRQSGEAVFRTERGPGAVSGAVSGPTPGPVACGPDTAPDP